MSYFHLGEDGDVGAHRQADRATHERSHSTVSSPCGECPLRGPLIEALLQAADRAGYRAAAGCKYSLQDELAIDEAIAVIRAREQ